MYNIGCILKEFIFFGIICILQEIFCWFGGELWDGEKVLDIIFGDIVGVRISSYYYRIYFVVLMVGVWVIKFFFKLQFILFFKVYVLFVIVQN